MKSIVISLGITTCTASLAAGEGTPRTRAEVMAERDAAQASGWITAMTGEDSGSFYLSQPPWVATRTRTVVIAGVKPASASGELAELHRESSDFLPPRRHAAAEPALRFVGPDTQGEYSRSDRMALTNEKR